MKKALLFIYIILSGTAIFAQVDSAQLINALQIGGSIANTVQPNDWIQGVPNSLVSVIVTTIVSAVYGLFHRRKTLKKLRREGKLND